MNAAGELVPKAAPNFDDLLEPRENHVWLAGQRSNMEPVAVAHPMDQPADGQLRRCVLWPDHPHVCGTTLWGERVQALFLRFGKKVGRMRRVLAGEPFEDCKLVGAGRAAYLNQELHQRRPVQGEILGTLIAYRTDRPEVAWIIVAAHRLVYNVADMETGDARSICGVRLTCLGSAHLAGKSVPVENVSPSLFGDATGECGNGFRIEEQIFAWLQIAAVIVSEDLVALFGAQFAHTPSPFAGVARGFAEFDGV